jgi:P27 family predicted phage terminase small subunit
MPESNAAPAPPDFLSAEAQQEWGRLAPGLFASGILTSTDIAAFAAYCQAWADFSYARRQIQAEGMLVVGALGNVIVNPLLSVQNRAAHTFHKFAVEFGITPRSRSSPSKKKPNAEPNRHIEASAPRQPHTNAERNRQIEAPVDDLDAFMRG